MTRDLRAEYTEKMKGWSDDRLRHEMSYIPVSDEAWATKEVMEAWNDAMLAEAERRGLTADG